MSRLPAAGGGPLVSLLPGPARLALAFQNARDSWVALQRSPLVAELDRAGAFDGLPAVPLVERWEALRGRLAELARLPLPPLTDLLVGQAVLAWVDGDATAPGGWIWIERLGSESRPALAFAHVLNAIRSSASEVEVDQRGSVPLRRVRLGPSGEVTYYVIADRLVVGSDPALVARSLDLALGGPRSAPVPFPRLEATAQAAGFAAELAPALGGARPLPLPGVRHLQLAGAGLSADLDAAIWKTPDRALPEVPGQLLRLEIGGLDLPGAWATLRPRPNPGAPESVVLDLDRLAGTLGRGVFFSIDRMPTSGVALQLTLATASDPTEALRRLLADGISGGGDAPLEDLPSGGHAICPWGDDGPACFSICPSELSIGKRSRLLAGAPTCGRLVIVEGPNAVAALRVAEPGGLPLLGAELHAVPGGWRGSWSGEPRP